MEVKDPIHGTLELNPAEVALIDSPVYQRLRLIKQLGFAEFSFPGATHNRFLHSLGVAHLAGRAFDGAFRGYPFSRPEVRWRLRQCLRLAAYLHDLGHGPLSHTTEEVMPKLSELNVDVYAQRSSELRERLKDAQATHEDYTIKYITGSSLSQALRRHFTDISPLHVACLIDKSLVCPDDFFVDQGVNLRTILSQMVSSEVDVDRMDYLERDAYFCGTNYGRVETEWLLGNLTYHIIEDEAYLALNRRALYTFDDFLISRHHMYLMVYFHHKSIVYEEMLQRYFRSPDCDFALPADIEAYTQCTDYALYEHMRKSENPWAQRIARRQPYRVLYELHVTDTDDHSERLVEGLAEEGIDVIQTNSSARLSKYHSTLGDEKALKIYVVDQYDAGSKPFPIEECTEIFSKYEETRRIERLYVAHQDYARAEKVRASLR